jgi:hypothetical protein
MGGNGNLCSPHRMTKHRVAARLVVDFESRLLKRGYDFT